MITKPTTHNMIREAQKHLGNDVSNKDVKQYCYENYGVSPMSQTIYSAIGSEWSRAAENISAKELVDSKKFVKRTFKGDKEKAHLAIDLIGQLT